MDLAPFIDTLADNFTKYQRSIDGMRPKGNSEWGKEVPRAGPAMASLQPTQKLKANLANPTIRRFLIHYFEL